MTIAGAVGGDVGAVDDARLPGATESGFAADVVTATMEVGFGDDLHKLR